jgi:hypothetical protein
VIPLLALALQVATPPAAAPPSIPAPPTHVTIEVGSVRARVSCEPERDRAAFCAPRRLEIFRDGALAFEESFSGARATAYLVGEKGERKSLELVDLDGDGEPELLLNLYSGGAHCCDSTWIYFFVKSPPHYESLGHDWGNSGYRLEDLDHEGGPEFLTGDQRFASAFTSYAASRLPPQIWRYASGRLEDVTRAFPAVIEKDAAACWKAFQEGSPNDATGDAVRGVAAAYVADEYLLGRGAEGWRRLIDAYHKPDRKKFFAALTDLLQKGGYSSP